MNLIDKTYFEDADLLIPGLEKPTQIRKVNELIDKYEPDFLKGLLGYGFYSEFMAGLATVDDNDEPAIPARWTDLRDGAEYTDASGVLRKWEGFCNDQWRSPVANYVYFYFLRYNGVTTTVSGEKASSSDKSTNHSSYNKQIKAWNEMVRMNHTVIDFLLNKKADGELVYPEFKLEELGDEFINLTTKIGGL